MDHSLTEQLVGDLAAWHTTIVAISESGEISELSRDIVQFIDGQADSLLKWSGRNRGRYRSRFAQGLATKLPRHSVFIFAISAQEQAILANQDLIIRELHLQNLVHINTHESGKKSVSIGPFIHSETGGDQFFRFPYNRFVMLLWIAHFLCRCHANFFTELRKSDPHVWALDWFLYHDKFPGDRRSPEFFNTVVRHHVPDGNIRMAAFDESDVIETDLLADNLAGLLNEYAGDNAAYPILQQILRTGQMYYECAHPPLAESG